MAMKFRLWIVLLLASLLASGCSTSLKFPLPPADSELRLRTPFVGTWLLTEAGGQIPPEPIEFRVSLGGEQNLVVEFTQHSKTSSKNFHLAQVDGLILAFLKNDRMQDVWDVAQLELDDTGQTLTVGALAIAPLKQHIADGVVAGQIDYWDADEDLLKIEAAGDELAAYFAAHPEIFDDSAVLTKVE